jgi:hypothetical protein
MMDTNLQPFDCISISGSEITTKTHYFDPFDIVFLTEVIHYVDGMAILYYHATICRGSFLTTVILRDKPEHLLVSPEKAETPDLTLYHAILKEPEKVAKIEKEIEANNFINKYFSRMSEEDKKQMREAYISYTTRPGTEGDEEIINTLQKDMIEYYKELMTDSKTRVWDYPEKRALKIMQMMANNAQFIEEQELIDKNRPTIVNEHELAPLPDDPTNTTLQEPSPE